MINQRSATPWLVGSGTNPDAQLRLFCFPYAGGNALIYRHWAGNLPASVEVCPVQLPGRGNRLREPSFTRLVDLVEALNQALFPYFDKPFAFFGHSMGGAISFELAHLLRAERGIGPEHLFVSGRRAPHLPPTKEKTYDLPEDEFIDKLSQLNGTPREVLENPELMQLLTPVLRADFELIQTYAYTPKPPLDCPVTAFGGLQDEETPPESLRPWGEVTNGPFSLMVLPGDHFFLQTSRPLLLEAISKGLSRVERGAV